MGAWGLGSDENDWTYDTVGFGILDRMSGVGLTEEGRAADGFVKDVVEMSGSDNVLDNVGVAILLLKLGCPVPVTKLQSVRAKLAAEKDGELYPDNAEERKAVVEKEIQLVDSAIENNGTVPGPPIGARGIFSSV